MSHLLQNASISQRQPPGRDEQDGTCAVTADTDRRRSWYKLPLLVAPQEDGGTFTFPKSPSSKPAWLRSPALTGIMMSKWKGKSRIHTWEEDCWTVFSLATILISPKA